MLLLTTSVVSRHPSRLVPSRFSCPVSWFPNRDWVRREWKGRKSLNLCILLLKVPANVKKLNNRNWNLNLGSFCCIIHALFHYFELWIKFCVVSNPVSTRLGFLNRVSICSVPPKTCLDTTLLTTLGKFQFFVTIFAHSTAPIDEECLKPLSPWPLTRHGVKSTFLLGQPNGLRFCYTQSRSVESNRCKSASWEFIFPPCPQLGENCSKHTSFMVLQNEQKLSQKIETRWV